MSTKAQIAAYIASQPGPKRADLHTLHAVMTRLMPDATLWFLDGRNAEGRTVSNPNIGYGSFTMPTAEDSTRQFYKIGLSANSTGISVYIMTLDDKAYLPATYAGTIGKASVTGYCIKFRALKDIDIAVLEAAMLDGMGRGG